MNEPNINMETADNVIDDLIRTLMAHRHDMQAIFFVLQTESQAEVRLSIPAAAVERFAFMGAVEHLAWNMHEAVNVGNRKQAELDSARAGPEIDDLFRRKP